MREQVTQQASMREWLSDEKVKSPPGLFHTELTKDLVLNI